MATPMQSSPSSPDSPGVALMEGSQSSPDSPGVALMEGSQVVLESPKLPSPDKISIEEREIQKGELLTPVYFPPHTVGVDSGNRFNQGNEESCSLHGFARCLVNHIGFNFRIDMPSLVPGVFPSDPLNTDDPNFGKYVAPVPSEGIDWLGIGKIALFSYFYPIIEKYYLNNPGAQFGTIDPDLEALVNLSLASYQPAEGAPQDFEEVVTEILQEYQERKQQNDIKDFKLWAVACDNPEYFQQLLERNRTTLTVIGEVSSYFGLLIELKGGTPADAGYHVLIVDSILPDGRFRIRHSWAGEASVMTVEQLHRGDCVVEKSGRTVKCAFLGIFYIGPQAIVEPSVSPLLNPPADYSRDSYHYKIGYENALRSDIDMPDKDGRIITREEKDEELKGIYERRGEITQRMRAQAKAAEPEAEPSPVEEAWAASGSKGSAEKVVTSETRTIPVISVLAQEAKYPSPSISISEAEQRYSTKRKYSSGSSSEKGLDKKPGHWFIINQEEVSDAQTLFADRLAAVVKSPPKGAAEGGKKARTHRKRTTKRKRATKRKRTRKRTKTLRHKN